MNRTVENSLAVMSKEYEQVRTDEASDTVTYIGYAEHGVAAGDAKWIIQKITSASGTAPTGESIPTWATSYKYNKNVWANRASLSYV